MDRALQVVIMHNFLKRDSAECFLNQLKQYTNSSDFIQLLQDKEKAKLFYKALGWYESGTYFGDLAAEILSGFSQSHPDVIADVIKQEKPLYEVGCQLIAYIFKNHYRFDRDKLYSCLVHYADHVNETIHAIINTLKPKEQINILGFGLRDGAYELSLANRLYAQGLAKKVTVYGFDPDSHEVNSSIQKITPAQLFAADCPKFDLIISRWVLHHVHFAERWDGLTQCINQANPQAKILIIEEGCFPLAGHYRFEVACYELLLACADVMINAGLHQQWLKDIAAGVDEPFFIRYLTANDLYQIEKQLVLPCTRTIYEVGPDFFGQTIISYDVVTTKQTTAKQKQTSLAMDVF